MQIPYKDIEKLKTILGVCKTLGIEGVVIHEGMVRGAKPSLDAAIISPNDLSISEAAKMGIGRVAELDKRLGIFNGEFSIDAKMNDAGDVSILTMAAGKTKMQFRCTNASLMKYPKSNDDIPVATIKLTKVEAGQLVKAVKTLSSETVILQVSRAGVVRFECVDSANDKFEIELSTPAKYHDEEQSLVQTYLAGLFVDVIDSAAREAEEIDFVVGEVGSITATLKGHKIMVMPQITEEEE